MKPPAQPDLFPAPKPITCCGSELFGVLSRLRAEGFVIEALDSLGGATWRLRYRKGRAPDTAPPADGAMGLGSPGKL